MLKGQRLTLRAIERDDLPHYATWVNDPEVTHHLLIYLPMNLEDETDWYEQQRRDTTSQNFAIVIQDNNQLIGSIGLMKIDNKNQNAELGIFIGDKTQWGQGYGQEAIRLLLNFAFKEMNLHRVYLRVDVSHLSGIRCYQQCGFVEEGRLRDAVYHGGQFEDQLLMGVLRPDHLGQNVG